RPLDFPLRLASLHLPKAAGVPKLIAEVATQFDVFFIENHILPEWRAPHRAEPKRVCAILIDQNERIGRVTQHLAHLPAQFVANDAGEVNIMKRQVAYVLVSRHDHASDPEKDDVGSGNEVGRGIESFERISLLRPTHRGKRPQPRTRPGVEDVGFLDKAKAGKSLFEL